MVRVALSMEISITESRLYGQYLFCGASGHGPQSDILGIDGVLESLDLFKFLVQVMHHHVKKCR